MLHEMGSSGIAVFSTLTTGLVSVLFLLFFADIDRALTYDILKIAVPALGAWGAAWLANRRENRVWRDKQGEREREMLDKQSDKLSTGWVEMTSQAREMINRLTIETIDAKTRASVAEEKSRGLEEKNKGLEKELENVKKMYYQALAEIDELKERGRRPAKPKPG